MGIFGKKEYDNQDSFNDYFRNTGTGDKEVTAPDKTTAKDEQVHPMPMGVKSADFLDHNRPAPEVKYEFDNVLKLGDKGITQIAAINEIAKANGWVFSVEFPGNKVDMYFEGKNYKIFCRGVNYSKEDHLPTGSLLAAMIKKNTASYDQQKYIFEKEQTMITSSQKMITEEDIKKLRVEASEIRKNLDGLINGLEGLDPKPEPINIPVEEFGKKHKAATITAKPESKKVSPAEAKPVTSSANLDATQKLETIEIPRTTK